MSGEVREEADYRDTSAYNMHNKYTYFLVCVLSLSTERLKLNRKRTGGVLVDALLNCRDVTN